MKFSHYVVLSGRHGHILIVLTLCHKCYAVRWSGVFFKKIIFIALLIRRFPKWEIFLRLVIASAFEVKKLVALIRKPIILEIAVRFVQVPCR
jgi:hypothetical protein